MKKLFNYTHYFVLCLYPDTGTTRERLIRRVDYSTGSVNYCLVTIIIRLISLYCQHWLSIPTLVVASDFVLINVDNFFHFLSHHLMRI